LSLSKSHTDRCMCTTVRTRMYVCIERRDRSKIRISARRKTTTAEGAPKGLPEATNSIGVFRITTNKTAAKERTIGVRKQ